MSTMDLPLYERTVKSHGLELDRLIKEEQGVGFLDGVDKPADRVPSSPADDKSAIHDVSPSAKHSSTSALKSKVDERRKSKDKTERSQFTSKLHSFIARKADLLFTKADEEDVASVDESPLDKNAEKSDYYAILPPLEQFLEVDPDVCQKRLFDILKVGSVVIGQILSTKEFGIFVKLLALCQDSPRFLDECEVVALLPAAELRDKFAHVASVEDFQIGDMVRALVIKVNVEEQKVIISLHAREESKEESVLGLITESELPVHYRRSVVQLDAQETYEDMLQNTVGFDNPFNVSYLGARLGLSDACPLSLMRGLQRSNFPEKEYAESLRKWQTNRWSMESVAKGVEYFKAGKLLDAMQHFNKALEIHEENVEALVARGALYANQDLLSKALQDFGKALEINPSHRNANKYMCQTLIERGKMYEEAGETEKAVDSYQTALDIKPDFLEAELCLSKINRTRTPAKQVASPQTISSSSPTSPTPGMTHISVEALRELVLPEKEASQISKKHVEKTKKKKKKKEKDKSKSSSKKDPGQSPLRESQRKSSKKKRRQASDDLSRGSSEASRSRSRSLEGSGRKLSRDGRKLDRSTSRNKTGRNGRRSHHLSSYSRSGSSDRSPTPSSRSRSKRKKPWGRKPSKEEKKHRSKRSSSYSRSSSSDTSRSRSRNQKLSKGEMARVSSTRGSPNSSKRKSLDSQSRSRRRDISRSLSRSSYSDSESSYISASPRTSRHRSKSQSPDSSKTKRSRDDRSREPLSRKSTKLSERSKSLSSSPKTRHQSHSQDFATSSKTNSTKKIETVPDVQERESVRPLSKSQESQFHTSSRSQSFHKSTKEEQTSSIKRDKDDQMALDFVEASQKLEKPKAKRRIETELKEDSKPIQKTSGQYKGTKSGSSQPSNSIPGRMRDGLKSKKDAESSSRDWKGLRSRSRSRSFSSDGSYSDESYSSYSLSGSRSYSYSSYSSYTSGSQSDSDDSHYRKKDKGGKSEKRGSPSRRDKKGSKKSGKSKMSESRIRDNERGVDDEDSSESEVDTGIYEISRDHLEMYMDSKSYQVKKVDDSPSARSKRKWKSTDKDETISKKRSKSEKKTKETPGDDKEEDVKPVLYPAAYKESRKTSKPVLESPSNLKEAKSKDFSLQRDGSHAPFPVPPQLPVPPAVDQGIKSLRGDSQAACIPPSAPSMPSSQSSESGSRHHRPDNTSLKVKVPNMHTGEHQGPSQMLQHRPETYGRPIQKFSSEQLSVIDSISKHLAGTREKLPHSANTEESHDIKAMQQHQTYREGEDLERGQRPSKFPNPGQGHHIGVIMTQRSSDTFGTSASLEPTDPFDDHSVRTRRRRWDQKTLDEDKDSGLDARPRERTSSSSVDHKPVVVSYDYQHGQDLIPPNNQSIDIRLKELRDAGASASGGFRGSPYDQMDTKQSRSGEYDHRRESAEIPGYTSHPSSRGERSRDNRPEDQSPLYFSPRPDHVKVQDQSVAPSLQTVKVVDYQHGRRDEHQERRRKGRDDFYEDKHRERHHSDRRRSSYDRQDDQREHRGSYNHGSDVRRRYDDRERHHKRDTHRDRSHRRSRDSYPDRNRSRTQGNPSPVEPKESNQFHQLVTSSKDMQVASLHSEGKWGLDSSPEEAKSSTRSWWL